MTAKMAERNTRRKLTTGIPPPSRPQGAVTSAAAQTTPCAPWVACRSSRRRRMPPCPPATCCFISTLRIPFPRPSRACRETTTQTSSTSPRTTSTPASERPAACCESSGASHRLPPPDDDDAHAFATAAGLARHHSGFRPAREFMDEASLGAVQEQLGEVCRTHGQRVQRRLTAPRLDSGTVDTCRRKHGYNSLRFEPCLVLVGCKRVDPEEDLLPFHGPWFSQLPYDIVAWQQPAPMCCADAYNIDMRDEHLREVFFRKIGFQDPTRVNLGSVGDAGAKQMMGQSLQQGAKAMKHLLAYEIKDEPTVEWLAGFILRLVHASHGLNKFMLELMDTVDAEGDEDVEMSADGNSFVQAHELGDLVAPSGRRAFEVARWSAERGAFLQVAAGNGTLASIGSAAWKVAKQIPGAIYNYGMKPVWKYVMNPLAKWGLSISKWVLEHPRAALFISKIALQVRDRMCEKTSAFVYGQPETHAVGAFSKVSEKVDDFREYMSSTFSPAVLLTGLQKALESSGFMGRLRSLGSAAFGPIMAWAGLATGGAAAALIGGLASMMADAAIDASKMALEFMVYQEIAKEVPSNLYDMLMSKCLFQRANHTRVTLGATADEVQVAARQAVAQVSEQVAEQGAHLLGSMKRFSSFFAGSDSGSSFFEVSSGNGTRRPEI
ncbi:unnamed protein product [Prorocentrum cordatum]|uniref:Uncharacterized protein n=1 Tax=Prorocentrum cordatum TaxID=2364126 RepID=A0ABN9P8P2_9DINO|nr:unnamed protein product [Polarella glacialis]